MNRKTVSRVLTFTILLIFIWYAVNNREALTELRNVSFFVIIVVAFGKLLTHLNNGLFTKLAAEQFVKKIKLAETIYISILSAIGNFLGPLLGGTAIRAVYLKKVNKLPYAKFTSTLAAYYLIIFTANSLLAIVSLLFLNNTEQTPYLLAFFAGILVFLSLVMLIKLPTKGRTKKTKNRYINIGINVVYEIEDGWKLMLANRKLMLKLSLLGLFAFLITYFTAFIEFRAVGAEISYAALGLYTSTIVLSMLISLTPGALGIREALLILLSTTLGVSNEQIIQVAIIDRGINFLVLLIAYLITKNKKIKKSITVENSI